MLPQSFYEEKTECDLLEYEEAFIIASFYCSIYDRQRNKSTLILTKNTHINMPTAQNLLDDINKPEIKINMEIYQFSFEISNSFVYSFFQPTSALSISFAEALERSDRMKTKIPP